MVNRLALTVAILAACGDNRGDGDELRQGGDLTVDDRTAEAFTHPASGLTADAQNAFPLGRSAFLFHWPPPVLGPLFNADGCGDCHTGNGRGLSQIGNSDAHAVDAVGSGWTSFPGRTDDDVRAAHG